MELKFVSFTCWVDQVLLLIKVVLVYRDDGLAAINNANGPKLYRIRKDITALFKKEGL